jgi:hypothetical protein
MRNKIQSFSYFTGVPLTTQWDPKGYYYPTQVCQYALAHWSKHIQDSNEKKSANTETLYEDGALHQVSNNSILLK